LGVCFIKTAVAEVHIRLDGRAFEYCLGQKGPWSQKKKVANDCIIVYVTCSEQCLIRAQIYYEIGPLDRQRKD